MANSGHKPSESEGLHVGAPGFVYDCSYPGWEEDNIAAQAAEIERLVAKNQGLIASRETFRLEILSAQQEMERLKAKLDPMQTERNIQIRGLLEKIRKMEAYVGDGEMVKRELQKAYMERHSRLAERQKLIIGIERVTEELQKAYADVRKLPEMQAELNGLRQEYQKICAAFEYEKSFNAEQVKYISAMEGYLVSMAREVLKLRTELMNSPNPYGGIYGNPEPIQGGGHVDGFYGHGGNPGAILGHGGSVSGSVVHGRTQAQVTSGIGGKGLNACTGESFAGEETKPSQVTMTGGLAAEEGRSPHGRVSGAGDGTAEAP